MVYKACPQVKVGFLQTRILLLLHNIVCYHNSIKRIFYTRCHFSPSIWWELAPVPLHTSSLLFQAHKGNKKNVAPLTAPLGLELSNPPLEINHHNHYSTGQTQSKCLGVFKNAHSKDKISEGGEWCGGLYFLDPPVTVVVWRRPRRSVICIHSSLIKKKTLKKLTKWTMTLIWEVQTGI